MRNREQPSAAIVVAVFDYHARTALSSIRSSATDYYPDSSCPAKRLSPAPPAGRPGGWIWNLGDAQPYLYRLPELVEAAAYGDLIVIVEGEGRPICFGAGTSRRHVIATGRKLEGGAFAAYLSGADVVILPDNDQAGRLHLDAVAVSL